MKRLLTAIVAASLLAVGTLASAGTLIPNKGAALGIGCNGADGMFSSDSMGLGCRIGGEFLTTRLIWTKIRNAPASLAVPFLVDGVDSDVRDWTRWMPINAVREGGVYLGDHTISVSGIVCVETECIGIGDEMLILNWNGTVAQVIIDGKFETIGFTMTDNEIVVGSERLGYVVHANRW
jgi:hypothetical protein